MFGRTSCCRSYGRERHAFDVPRGYVPRGLHRNAPQSESVRNDESGEEEQESSTPTPQPLRLGEWDEHSVGRATAVLSHLLADAQDLRIPNVSVRIAPSLLMRETLGWSCSDSREILDDSQAAWCDLFVRLVTEVPPAALHEALRRHLVRELAQHRPLSAKRWAELFEIVAYQILASDQRLKLSALRQLQRLDRIFSRRHWADAFGLRLDRPTRFAKVACYALSDAARTHRKPDALPVYDRYCLALERHARSGGSFDGLDVLDLLALSEVGPEGGAGRWRHPILLAQAFRSDRWASALAVFCLSTQHIKEALTEESVQSLAMYLRRRCEAYGRPSTPVVEVGAGSGRASLAPRTTLPCSSGHGGCVPDSAWLAPLPSRSRPLPERDGARPRSRDGHWSGRRAPDRLGARDARARRCATV